MQDQTTSRHELDLAEADAQRAEADEQSAHDRFRSLRESLARDGKADQATEHPEFHSWMSARDKTDRAWGRWAMAMDASLPATTASRP